MHCRRRKQVFCFLSRKFFLYTMAICFCIFFLDFLKNAICIAAPSAMDWNLGMPLEECEMAIVSGWRLNWSLRSEIEEWRASWSHDNHEAPFHVLYSFYSRFVPITIMKEQTRFVLLPNLSNAVISPMIEVMRFMSIPICHICFILIWCTQV